MAREWRFAIRRVPPWEVYCVPANSPKEKSFDRVAIISSVKTYLAFFVLVVLVVESVLGTIALKAQDGVQLVALYGMLFVIVGLIVVVSLFAYFKPEALLRTFTATMSPEIRSTQEFCQQISGHWWERIHSEESRTSSAISFFEIRPDHTTNTVKMNGRAYTMDGMLWANWESVASCVNPNERKVFYYWKGLHPSRPNEPFEGFGEISFREFSNQIDSGDGVFSDTNIMDIRSTRKKSIALRRGSASEVQVMKEGNNDLVSEMVRNQLKGGKGTDETLANSTR